MTRVARYYWRYSSVRDLDMTPTFIMVFYIVIASRYIACGNGDDELFSLSGVAIVLFVGVPFFVGRLR